MSIQNELPRNCYGAMTETGPDCDGTPLFVVVARETIGEQEFATVWCADCLELARQNKYVISSVAPKE